MKKRIGLLPMILLLALIIILGRACSTQKNKNSSATDEPVFDWEKVRKDSFPQSPNDDPVPAKTPVPEAPPGSAFPVSVADAMVASGEIIRYWPGDDLCIVYQVTSGTWDEASKHLCGVINGSGKFTVGLNEAHSEGDVLWPWLCYAASYFPDGTRDINDSYIHYLGNNIFAVDGYGYGDDPYYYPYDASHCLWIYDANANSRFWLGTHDKERVYQGFHNGVIITAGINKFGKTCLSILSEDGTITTKILHGTGQQDDFDIGEYSEGLFYFDGSFYNADLECVIAPSPEYSIWIDSADLPRFVDGVCHLEAIRNDKLWNITIDKSGNMIGEPTEIME